MAKLSRAEAKGQTRARLLDAAEILFLANGYAATSMEQIAQEVGVTKPAIYRHFPSKEDLFLALRERRARLVDVSSLSRDGGELQSRLAEVGETVADLASGLDPRVLALGLEFRAVSLRRPEARERFADEIRALVAAAHEHSAGTVEVRAGVTDAEVLILGQLLVEGLMEYHAFVPDIITPNTFSVGLQMLASLTDR